MGLYGHRWMSEWPKWRAGPCREDSSATSWSQHLCCIPSLPKLQSRVHMKWQCFAKILFFATSQSWRFLRLPQKATETQLLPAFSCTHLCLSPCNHQASKQHFLQSSKTSCSQSLASYYLVSWFTCIFFVLFKRLAYFLGLQGLKTHISFTCLSIHYVLVAKEGCLFIWHHFCTFCTKVFSCRRGIQV